MRGDCNMEIRNSKIEDMNQIMEIYSIAREYMLAHGNKTQWTDGYPKEELLRNDIQNNNNYVIIEDNKIVGTFSFIIGEDPTYQIIKNGNWHYDRPYGTIHRLASNGSTKGISKVCFEFCLKKINYIRVDTHKDNLSMQNVIKKFGFERCGNIYVRDGSERIAYDYFR